MKALEEEGPGSSGLGAFFGRSEGATGSGGTDNGPQWDGDAAWRQRQAEELAEEGIFFGEFTGREQGQTVGNAPTTHQEASTASKTIVLVKTKI